MKIEISDDELNERLELSYRRMCEPFYDIDNVFADENAAWPGDKEGRALLAFVCLHNAGMPDVPCMEKLIDKLPGMMNEKGYLGKITDEFFEQQLSGHSWLLRGLCEYFELTQKQDIMPVIEHIVENLYMPLYDKIKAYPLARKTATGGVDGHTSEKTDGWLLSTDTCCAFMSIDGLSHVYKLTKDKKLKELISRMTQTFMCIDKYAIKAQTHCTLTAARGMIRMYRETGNDHYLRFASEIMKLYTDHGMTYTYENYNWWGRPDTWTEPCGVVDSLMLATELYKITGKEEYRTLAARIFHNGFATNQRDNGGAGTSKIVYSERPLLEISGYEAKQCCSMRFAEGLKYVKENRSILYAISYGKPEKNEKGVYFDGDIIYCETAGDDTHTLHPLIKYYKLSKDEIMSMKQKIVFN